MISRQRGSRRSRSSAESEVYKRKRFSYVLSAMGAKVVLAARNKDKLIETEKYIKESGGEPANFLDVGGTADAERVEIAFNLILKDPSVKAILVNIFGGIVRCDRVAQGIIDAYKSIVTINIPIIVRLEGTNADIAKKIIDESGLDVHSVIEFQEAADKVQELLA